MKFRVHADRIAPFKDLMEQDMRTKAAPDSEAPDEKEDYEVESIVDDTGSRAAGTKKYLVRWKGWGPEHDEWVKLDDLNCPEEVQQYELRKVGVYGIADCPWTKCKGTAVFAVQHGQQDVVLKMDLNGEETPEALLETICKKAGVERKDIVLAWASPPCETYSRANWSNLSRGNHYRDKSGGESTVSEEKATKARQHDRLTQRVKEVLQMIKFFVMENPQGGMEKMWFMADWESKKRVVELCAYMWPFKKTTNLWTNLGKLWQQNGTTGNGRCGDKCTQGDMDPITKRFRHFMALAVHPERGPRGVGSAKMTCGIPDMLITEILKGMAEAVNMKGKVVLDLCAGFNSIRNAVLKAGASYVGVDIEGERKARAAQPRRTAIVLSCGDSVLAVKHKLKDGTHAWTLPAGKLGPADTSLHAAGMRELREKTGLEHRVWRDQVVEGPSVCALSETTYYTYTLNRPIPRTTMERVFAARAATKQDEIGAWEWIHVRERAPKLRWRREDYEYLERQGSTQGRGSGGC